MPRMPRFFIPDTPLHVIVRGNNRGAIFADDDDRRFLRGYLGYTLRIHEVAAHAYVFMTNHVHLLATPDSPQSMPRAMQDMGRTYVRYFNDKYGRTGTLWEGRYRAAIVDDEHYLLTCMRYIELNPVRARMVEHPSEFQWSSFACNAMGSRDPLVTPHALYLALGASAALRRRAYGEATGMSIPQEELDRIRDATRFGWALGGSDFCARVDRLTRRATRQALGRPVGARAKRRA